MAMTRSLSEHPGSSWRSLSRVSREHSSATRIAWSRESRAMSCANSRANFSSVV